jgi:chitodextrinase
MILLLLLTACGQESGDDPRAASITQGLGTTSALASDAFNRADGALGGGWKTLTSNPRIVGQHVQEATAPDGYDGIAIYEAVSWPADQYSQVTITATNQFAGCSPIVRAKNSAVVELYFAYVVGPLGAGAQVVLAKFVQYNYAEIWSGVATVNAGDTLFLGAEANTLTVKLNGNTLVTRTDSSISTGFAGFDLTDYGPPGAVGAGQCDNWEGGSITANTVPTPTNLTATATSSSQVSLAWTASSGATGYKVFRDGAQIGTTAGTSFNDSGLGLGTTHGYAVAATDANGNSSALSSTVSVTTLGDTLAPSTPGGLAGTAVSSTQVNLTWSAATDNVGVTGYRISRNGSQLGTTSALAFADTGLSPSTSYSYAVSAIDAAGNASAASAAVSVTTLTPADTISPSAPSNLAGNATSTTQIELTWTAATDNVGVSSYRISRDGAVVGTVTGTAFTDAGLSPATSYSYAVTALDAAGNASTASAAVSITTLTPVDTTPPSPPTSLVGVASSTTQISLSWSASTDNVGVVGYAIYRGGSLLASTVSTTFADTELSPATTYTYSVVALDAAANTSTASNSVSVTTQAPVDTSPPSVPSNLAASAGSSTQISLTWTASTDNVAIAGYRVYRDGASVAVTISPAFSDGGLTPATSYSYAVAAIDVAGNASATSAPVVATTLTGPHSTILASDDFNRPDGSPGPGWTVIDSNPRISSQHLQENHPSDGNDSIMIHTGVAWPNDQYTQLTVKAASANAGCAAIVRVKNDPVIEMYFVYVIGPLGPGAELVLAKFVGHNYTELWSSVQTVNSGDKLYLSAVGTTLTVKLNGDTLTTQQDSSITAGYSGVDVTDYAGGNPGDGQCDDWEGGAIGAGSLLPPTNLAASALSSTQVQLSWSGSVGAAGYGVFRNGTQIGTSLSSSFSDSGLALGTSYTYSVTAYDEHGNSSPSSAPVVVATLGDSLPPSAPSNLTGSALSSTQITLSWAAATDNVAVTGYEISRNGSLIGTSAAPSFTDSGLSPSTTYSYRVVAVDGSSNESAASAALALTTPAADPEPSETALASDDFNQPNGALQSGWTIIDSNPRIVNQSVQEISASDGNDSIAIYTGVAWPANQYTRLTVTAATANGGCAAIVRAKNDPVIEMYFVYVIGPLGPGAQLVLAKFVQHNYTELWSSTLTVNAGDSLYLSAVGTTLTVKLNGNTLATRVDGSIVAGYSGFDVTDYSGGGPGHGGCDNWEGGLAVAP